jgi:hypothetical protein
VISLLLIAESPQTPALDQHRSAILDDLDIGAWRRTGATLDTWILDLGSVEKGRTAYIHQRDLYIVLITTLDEAKRYGKGGRGPRQNMYFGQGWEGRNGKYGILTDGKEGQERKGKERKGKGRKRGVVPGVHNCILAFHASS